jgi:hypothetical protein
LTTRMPKVCKTVIAANGGFFDKSKVWRTQLLFQLKIIIYNLVLTIFPIHFATNFIHVFMENKDISKWPQTFERYWFLKNVTYVELSYHQNLKYKLVFLHCM